MTGGRRGWFGLFMIIIMLVFLVLIIMTLVLLFTPHKPSPTSQKCTPTYVPISYPVIVPDDEGEEELILPILAHAVLPWAR